MAGIFGGGARLPAPQAIAPPTAADPAVAAAAAQQAATNAQMAGRASTVLTSGQGVPGTPPSVRKTLLGQ